MKDERANKWADIFEYTALIYVFLWTSFEAWYSWYVESPAWYIPSTLFGIAAYITGALIINKIIKKKDDK